MICRFFFYSVQEVHRKRLAIGGDKALSLSRNRQNWTAGTRDKWHEEEDEIVIKLRDLHNFFIIRIFITFWRHSRWKF